MDDTLDAEQHAARTAARRRRSLRDLLLAAEDRNELAVISGSDGQLYRGVVEAVGADHVTITLDGRTRHLTLHQIVAIEVGG